MGRHGFSSTRASCWATTLCCCSAGACGVSTSGAGGFSPRADRGTACAPALPHGWIGGPGAPSHAGPVAEPRVWRPIGHSGGRGGGAACGLGWCPEAGLWKGCGRTGDGGAAEGRGCELTEKWSPRARVRPWSDRWRRGCRPQRRFASSFDSRPFILPVSTSVAVLFSRRRCHSCGNCTGEKQSPCQVRSPSHSA